MTGARARWRGPTRVIRALNARWPGCMTTPAFLNEATAGVPIHASVDVRAGLLTREEGFELAKQHDTERPKAFDEYLKLTGFF